MIQTKTRKEYREYREYDISKITITNEAPTSVRHKNRRGKYIHLFQTIKPGQRLKCPKEYVYNIHSSWLSYMKRNGIYGRIQMTLDCGDGFGGLWWIVDEQGQKAQEGV